ncbi:hypothetical protein FIU87_17095 [Bacillus sp. THAF10]|uniref:hypothetical protein n=1 Tax=Bacillus sp. THAF10 TaxID=2587848 RepID=UPI001268027E|nr:hypothetical protein [Bacillus sp. THAF10]QFT90359.1 hypothetical protein FIU87_17095 [Bacillus sp. THAF10]
MTHLLLTPNVQKIKADIGDIEVAPIVERAVKEMYEEFPFLDEKFGEKGKAKTIEDNFYHFLYLHTAYKLNDIDSFIDYTLWLKSVLVSRGVGSNLITYNYKKLCVCMAGMLDTDIENKFQQYLTAGIQALEMEE